MNTASWRRGFRSVWRSLRGCATRDGSRARLPAPARGALGLRSGGWRGLIRPILRPPRCSRMFGFPFSFPPTAIHGILDSGRGQNGRLEFWVVAVRLPTGCCWVIASTTTFADVVRRGGRSRRGATPVLRLDSPTVSHGWVCLRKQMVLDTAQRPGTLIERKLQWRNRRGFSGQPPFADKRTALASILSES